MSPEQARGDPAHIGLSSDLYALGLIAYKLLVGTPYWNATSVAGIIGQVLYEAMAPPSSRGSALGPEFDQWFLRACNRDASLRFGSAIEQVEMLARALNLPTADAALEGLRSNPGTSNPGASGDAFVGPGTQVSPGAGHYGGETIAQSGHTLVSSSSSTGARMSITHPQRRKTLVYAVFPLAILIVIGVVMFSKKDPEPASTVLATPSPGAPAIGSAAAMPAAIAPAPPASTEAPPTEGAGSAAKPGAIAAATPPLAPGKRKEPVPLPRPTPARSAPTPGAAHGERGGTNDPLGDQK
jgi:serine/threonine-protein kinase